jgi:hypothetical protein
MKILLCPWEHIFPGGASARELIRRERERDGDRGRESERERDAARRDCRSKREREKRSPQSSETQSTVAGNAATTTAWLTTTNIKLPVFRSTRSHYLIAIRHREVVQRISAGSRSNICGSRSSTLRFAEQPPFLEPAYPNLPFSTDPTTK